MSYQQTRQDLLHTLFADAGYNGSVDDQKLKILSEAYPDITGSVSDREFEVLGSLGFEGSLSDRWAKYYISLGGSGLETLDVLDQTFFLGVEAITPSEVVSGYWFDANNLLYGYTDPFKTTQLTGSGDSVGYLIDVAELSVDSGE